MAKRVQEPEDPMVELARRVQDLQDDISGIAESLKAVGASRLNAASSSILHAVDAAGETVRDTVKMTSAEALHRGEAAAEEVGAVISRNPIPAILVSLGLGFIIGAMKRR